MLTMLTDKYFIDCLPDVKAIRNSNTIFVYYRIGLTDRLFQIHSFNSFRSSSVNVFDYIR